MIRAKIIELVIEACEAYTVTDDSKYDPDVVGAIVDAMRESEIQSSFPVIDDKYYQLVCCLEILCVSQGCTIDGIGLVPSGTVLFYVELPALISDIKWSDIKYLGYDTLVSGFTRVTIDGFRSVMGRIYTSGESVFTIIGDRAYFRNVDPERMFLCGLMLLQEPADSCAYDPTQDYPVPSVMRLIIASTKHILSTYGIVADVQQDSSEQNIIANGKNIPINKGK